MKKNSKKDKLNGKTTSRRNFIKDSTLATAGVMIVPRYVLGGKGYVAPSDKLNIAGIGVGGRGKDDLAGVYNKGAENIVALCDVDETRAAATFKAYKKAKRYKDFRVMLEQQKDIDAVVIATPDNTHAVAAMAAMQLGKHVYVEKPLAHDIYEARVMTEAARKYNVVTQMGNQGSSWEGTFQVMEWMEAGIIGDVDRVHCWTNRPIWPQGIATPKEKVKVPNTLDWDLWLGPAKWRDYNPAYLPFKWRGWWDFGTGALGDMACHIIDPAFRALKLGYPTAVEASVGLVYVSDFVEGDFPDSCPPSSKIHFDYPARDGMPPVKLIWYDGGIMPERPEELGADEQMGDWNGGLLFEGTKGKIMTDCYGANPRLLPTSSMQYFKQPEKSLKRVPEGHHQNWVKACKGEVKAVSNFDIAGPLTEMILIGNLAIRSYLHKELKPGKKPGDWAPWQYPGRKKLLWDSNNMKVTNFDQANQFVKRDYRDGWSLGV
ncbi:Gfo/Idh/MocA family oxidoreductase [Fulvivirgaceae bacterium BMA10]|uniref:Gfo/Idh/MocA family oxidoreductase n=1 Tax=Splendidivirga corallicola TaxID=3051826 RepID=A0ABT8KR55_9BACT|nr:Gfo/Idh/MocA family oxidoreductase [Fulvivirgaceae bacterium BMA10]